MADPAVLSVQEQRAHALAAKASAPKSAAPKAPAPKAQEPEEPEMAPPAPDMPEPKEPEEPDVKAKYAVGQRVSDKDPARANGEISEVMDPEPVYRVKCDDGSEYTAPESELMEEDDDMTENERMAPAALVAAFDLPKGSTVADCVGALEKERGDAEALIKAAKDEAAEANASAKSAALNAANVHADLADLAADALVKGEGQDWAAAVAALKASRPSLFASAVETPKAPEGDGDADGDDNPDGDVAPAAKVVEKPAAKMPNGANAPDRKGEGLTPNTGAAKSWRARMNTTYGGRA